MDPVKARVATIWLGGCSGCHMSFLDMDERLLDLAARMDLVYGPFVDVKEFPRGVDLTLVEGAVSTEDHLAAIHTVRERTRLLVAFGDCAVTGNVTALRNALGPASAVLERAYRDLADVAPSIPSAPGVLPRLLDRVLPVHHVVRVDAFLPGCPPHPDLVHALLEAAIAGRPLAPAAKVRFG